MIGSHHDHDDCIVPGPGSRGGRAATGGGGAAELEAVRPLVQTISTLDTGSQVSTSKSQNQIDFGSYRRIMPYFVTIYCHI